jgi:hypothetical protein
LSLSSLRFCVCACGLKQLLLQSKTNVLPERQKLVGLKLKGSVKYVTHTTSPGMCLAVTSCVDAAVWLRPAPYCPESLQ